VWELSHAEVVDDEERDAGEVSQVLGRACSASALILTSSLLQYFSTTGEDSGELQTIRVDSETVPRTEKDSGFDEKPHVIEGLQNPPPRVQVPYSSLPSC
jgi:hypothetical protein